MDRVLGATRQSRTKTKVKGVKVDPVSIETQRGQIHGYADSRDATVVKITEDPSTSGSKSCFKRPGLGPWLSDEEKIAAWDVLVLTKLDRGCRDVADYLRLATWCTRNQKKLVILDDPSLDTTTPSGEAMGTMRAVFAQLERKMAQERNRERYQAVVDSGKWPGGAVKYGWRHDPERRVLVPDEGGQADILREMADLSIAGKSNGAIAKWLNENGNLTSKGFEWRPDKVRKILLADATVIVIGEAKAAQLRAALRSRSQVHASPVGAHMLLRVAYCADCQGPLYGNVRNDRPSGGNYKCVPCGTYYGIAKLEAFVEKSLLKAVGHRKLRERVLVPGDDHQTQIHALENEIETLQGITGTETVIAMKQAEIDNLKAEPFEADRYAMKTLDVKVGAYWGALDREGRGDFLRKWGVRLDVSKEGAKLTLGWLDADDDATFPVG